MAVGATNKRTPRSQRRIFLDIGGHLGQTIEAALDPAYGFDALFTLEPARECANVVAARRYGRVIVMNVGLAKQSGEMLLIGAGSDAASVHQDYPDASSRGPSEVCFFMRATDFVRGVVLENDRVWAKLNCEGSEIDILEDLIDSGEIRKIHELLVCFDARKITRLANRVPVLTETLRQIQGLRLCLPEDVMFGQGSHYGAIRNWLNVTGARCSGLHTSIATFGHHAFNVLTRRHLGFYKLKILRMLPTPVVSFYYRRVKKRLSVLRVFA